MMAHLFEPQTAPFAVALGLMLLIAALEIIGLFFGVAFSELVDAALPDMEAPDLDIDADIDADLAVHGPDLDAPAIPSAGPFTQFLAWLCVGRVPILVLFVAFLTAFGLTGLIMQGLFQGLFGFYLPAIVAVAPALAAAIPATRYLGLGLSHIMPKVQSDAVSHASFVGQVAVILRGVAKPGQPAEAKLTDRHGQAHYLLVEPDVDDQEFAAGDEVLVVRQTGSVFRAIANTHAALSRSQ